MRNFQLTDRRDVAASLLRERKNIVLVVRCYGINLTIFRVNIETLMVFEFGFPALNHLLRFERFRAQRRIVQTIKYAEAKLVGVLKNDFIRAGVDGDGDVNWIR